MLGPMRWFGRWCLIVAAVALAGGCGDTTLTSNNTPLTNVTATVPVAGATGVAVNGAVVAVFDKAMDPATTAASFTLASPAGAVSGTVALDPGKTIATFTPASQLSPNTRFTATITTGAHDTFGNPLTANFTWSFTTGTSPDTTLPAIVSTIPANGATGVVENTLVTVTFSEPVSAATINSGTITLSSASGPVTGTIAFNGTTTASFTPNIQLAAGTLYTATVSNGVTDLAGNHLVGSVGFSFTTGATVDVLRPTALSVSPATGTTGVSVNSGVSVTFSEMVNAATINTGTVTLAGPAGPVTGTVVLDPGGTTATFTPISQLAGNTLYTATVTTGVTDQAGNHLATTFTSTFSTAPDTVPPTVLAVTPPNGTSAVPLSSAVSATFSEAMTPNSVNSNTFTLSGNTTGAVAGNISVNGTTAIFVPLFPLTANTTFTATIKSAEDPAGNRLAAPFVWSFTTGPGP